jgi:hypothetical protein
MIRGRVITILVKGLSPLNYPLTCLILFLNIFTLSSFAQKTDTIFLDNGDRIIGEVKSLEYGLLTHKTNSAGTLQVEWEDITFVLSNKTFEVEMKDGTTYYGQLVEPDEAKRLLIQSENFSFSVDMIEVVKLHQIKNRFWARIDGSVSLGINYTKSSTLGQLDFSSNITYRYKKNYTMFSYDGTFTNQENPNTKTRRQDLSITPYWLLQKRWFAGVHTGLQQNSELGLDMRIMLGGGIGESIIQTNRNNMNLLGGLVANREFNKNQEGGTNNLEAYVNFYYTLFKYNTPKTNLTIQITVYPGLTDWGRVRADFNVNATQEIITDFTIGLSFYDNFDNRPAEGSSKNDWGITTSVGYTF